MRRRTPMLEVYHRMIRDNMKRVCFFGEDDEEDDDEDISGF